MLGADDEDLIGGPVTSAENIGEQLSFRTDSEVHGLNGGVSVAWLMKAFRMGRGTLERKMRGCAPIGRGKHGSPLYDLPEVASFIVMPRHAIATYLEDAKPEDLPEKMRDSYWTSKLKQQRYEEKAGDLWRTHKVIETISDVLTDLRSMLQLIPDETHRKSTLSKEQSDALTVVVEAVQQRIYEHIVDLSKNQSTPNQLGEENDSGDDLI